MNTYLRFYCYQNYMNRRYILIFLREVTVDRPWVRAYGSKKEELLDKLENLDQKIQKVIRKKTIACLDTKCKHGDTSLPQCKASDATQAMDKRELIQHIPSVCPRPLGDTCIRPYVNPCPPYPVKPCSPFYRTVDPCRVICKRPKPATVNDGKIMELSIRTKKILLALTTLLALIIIYKILTSKEEIQYPSTKGKKKRMKKPKEIPKVPFSSGELPKFVPYIIVGGGPAAYSALKTITSLEEDAKVLVINKELYYPYDRTTLNTELLLGEPHLSKQLKYFPRNSTKKKSIFYEQEAFYASAHQLSNLEEPGTAACVALGYTVALVNHDNKYVQLEDGKKISYGKCILATGSSPKQLRVFTENSDDVKEKVSTYSTVQDYCHLEEVLDAYGKDCTIAVVGGGWNGTELACSLNKRGVKVIQLYKENGNMSQILPQYISDWLTKKIMKLGVTVLNNTEVLDALVWKGKEHKGSLALYVDRGNSESVLVFADHVIVAIGNEPNTELALQSGIEVDNERGGFLVNRELQIRTDLYAVGDCISYYDNKYGRRHIEHYEHAVETGKVAAENMLGKSNTFDIQTKLWSDITSEIGYEAVGIIDSTLPTVGVFVKEGNGELETINYHPNLYKGKKEELGDFNKGVVFYLKNKSVVGILTLNVYNRAAIIKRILAKDATYDDVNELAKSLKIHH